MSQKINLFVVDDDPLIRSVYKKIFKKQEDIVLEMAESGDEALQRLEGYFPDIILLDIMMPGLNGYEVCQKIRENPLYKSIKVILVSAKAMLQERLDGYKVGADDYVCKPFDQAELEAKVRVFAKLKSVQEVNHMRSVFLTMLSHRTNNPLNGIMGFAQLIGQSSESPEDVKNWANDIQKCGKEIHSLSEKLLFWGNLKNGQVKLRKKDMDLNDLILKTLDSFEDKLAPKNFDLKFQLDETIPVVQGQNTFVAMVIKTILENAADYCEHLSKLCIETRLDDNKVVVDIKSHGSQIDPKRKFEIFQGFFSEDVEHQDHRHGFSLAISKLIMQLHDGDLDFENHQLGVTFSLSFPLGS